MKLRGKVTASPGTTFSPSALFAASERGVWYDPSDLTTLFQDTAGTVPVTADGNLVKCIKDKSGNNIAATFQTATAAPIYRTNGTLRWLEFDTNACLVTSTLDLSISNEASIFTSYNVASGAAPAILYELSASIGSNSGTFLGGPMNWDGNASTSELAFSRGDQPITVDAGAQVDSLAVPRTETHTALHKIGTNSTLLRLNGVQVASDSAVKGNGNFGTFPLYLGARNQSTLPFTGKLYGFIVRSVLTADPLLTQAENWLKAKAGL